MFEDIYPKEGPHVDHELDAFAIDVAGQGNNGAVGKKKRGRPKGSKGKNKPATETAPDPDPLSGRTLAQEVEDRFKQYLDTDNDDVTVDLDSEEESSEEEGAPQVCISIPNAYFRVDPREPMRVRCYRPQDSRNLFLVAGSVKLTRPDIYRFAAYLAKTRDGHLKVWCVRRPTVSGSDFPTWQSYRRIAQLARTAWWGMRWEEQPNGKYKLKAKPYPNITDTVTFPETPIEELVVLAFEGRTIESADDARLSDIPDLSDAKEFS